MNSSQILSALKAILPALEPIVAVQVDALLVKAEQSLDAKMGSPDLKFAADCLAEAAKKVIDWEMGKFAPGAQA